MSFSIIILLTVLIHLPPLGQNSPLPKANQLDIPSAQEIDKHIQLILNSKYPYSTSPTQPGFMLGYQPLFAKIKSAGIRQLQTHSNDGVALRAAWEEIRQTLPKEERNPSLPTLKLDTQKMNRFLGFLEGRVHVATPSWWEKAFLTAQAHRRDNVFFHIPHENWPYGKYQEVEPGHSYHIPVGTTISRAKKELLLKIENETVVIPSQLLRNSQLPFSSLSASIGERSWFLAAHSSRCSPYKLLRIDRTSGKIIWEADVWAAGGFGLYMGQGYHFVTVLIDSKRVIVFGMGGDAAYVEGFKSEDGINLFRFTTAH